MKVNICRLWMAMSVAMLTAVLASCAESYQYGLESKETESSIAFHSSSADSSRSLLLYGYMNKIDGSVTPVFNAAVAYSDNGSIIYSGDRKWDLSASDYRFYAYIPGQESVGYDRTESREALTFYGLQQKKSLVTPTLYTDECISIVQDGFPESVNLDFKTPYALLRIVFESDSDSRFCLDEIHFGPVINSLFTKADVTVTHHHKYTEVNLVRTGAETAAFIDFGSLELSQAAEILLSMNVLPHGCQGRYRLTAFLNGQEMTAFVPSLDMTWNPNMCYTYVFHVSEDAIQFKRVEESIRKSVL